MIQMSLEVWLYPAAAVMGLLLAADVALSLILQRRGGPSATDHPEASSLPPDNGGAHDEESSSEPLGCGIRNRQQHHAIGDAVGGSSNLDDDQLKAPLLKTRPM
jgi:hypothetical protein